MDTSGQQCQICRRTSDAKLLFYCHRCARNAIYEPRLNLARALLERESKGKEIEAAITTSRNDDRQPSTAIYANEDGSKKLEYESARSQYRLVAARTQIILDDSRSLQEEIEKMRTRLADLKASIAKRRRSVKLSIQEIRYEEETSVKPVNESIASVCLSWDRLHSRVVSGRHVLPRELIALYGLQVRRRRKGLGNRDTYQIAGVPVFNLKELNNAVPEHLNTSTQYVAHLIHLCAHYLGLRLPAEISLATAGQPYTFIHPPMSSYKASMLGASTRDSPSKTIPRKRVLLIEKPLAQLASEDSQAYSLYLDAIILLAWNVAWVAKTQGIDVGGKGWEDICLVGKNLWDLFGGDVGEDEVKDLLPTNANAKGEFNPKTCSQASAHSFLNHAGDRGGADYMKSWKYSNPTRIIETVKSALINERMGADWEVLEKPEEEEAATVAAAEETNRQHLGLKHATDPPKNGNQPSSTRTRPVLGQQFQDGWTKIRG